MAVGDGSWAYGHGPMVMALYLSFGGNVALERVRIPLDSHTHYSKNIQVPGNSAIVTFLGW